MSRSQSCAHPYRPCMKAVEAEHHVRDGCVVTENAFSPGGPAVFFQMATIFH